METNTKDRVNVRVDKETKEQAKAIYHQLGLDMSTAINMFLKQTVMTNSLPLETSINKLETEQAMRDALNGNTEEIGTIDDFDSWVKNL